MDCRGDTTVGAVGNILVTRMMKRGAIALVTDGSVRDSPLIASMEFPVFCRRGAAPLSLTAHHVVDYQLPIGCGGVSVFPGDILVGDAEGVVAIPRHIAPLIAEGAVAEEKLERFLLRRIQHGSPLPGTYPPDDDTLAAYRKHREQDL